MVTLDLSVRLRLAVVAYCLCMAVWCYLPSLFDSRWWRRHSLMVSLLSGIPVSVIVFFVTG